MKNTTLTATRPGKRKRRPGEVVCRCGVYRFPHRFMGGACDGGHVVRETWERGQWGECRGCVSYVEREPDEADTEYGTHACQVLLGQEEIRECPALIDKIRYEGVKLYGVNRPPPRRAGWRR